VTIRRRSHDEEDTMSLDEASRQLEQAIHDAQVAFDCIGLGHIDRAHTNALTARTAADAAENALRHALSDGELPPDADD
jgi:hypothetical protein